MVFNDGVAKSYIQCIRLQNRNPAPQFYLRFYGSDQQPQWLNSDLANDLMIKNL
jgi:hypothetical protein